MNISYDHATRGDLCDIARIFIRAFPESIAHYVGRPIPPDAIRDVFGICLAAEPDAFFVARADGRVAGYVFAPSSFPRLVRAAIWRGHLLGMFWRWISRTYHIGLRPVLIAAQNWVALLRESHEPTMHADARILSIAVDPDFQGEGIGTGLMNAAMGYLQSRGVPAIRLEVRPDNGPAKHVYEKYGFKTIGETRDTQGDWLVMVKDLRDHPRE